MEIVRTFEVNDSTLASSNISDTADYALYNAATTYALGNTVVGVDHHEYESLQNSNTGHALSEAAWWLDLGYNRRWRMFDLSNSSQSSNADEIDVSIDVTGRANAVSLLNIVADTAQIIVTTVDGEIYNETFNLTSDSGVNNWYDYFFEPIVRVGDLVVTDLPLNANPTIQVILTATGSTVRIGTLIVGQSLVLGATVYGAEIGIQDYSRKVADDFGNWTIVERPFAKRATFEVFCDAARTDAITAFLASIRATPCVFRGSGPYTSLYVFGFYKDWRGKINKPLNTTFYLEVEGLT